jgi:exodeoxyribonuclease VII small subunit
MNEELTGAEKPSYADSMKRLKELVAKLESAQVDVDEMEAVVKESVGLIASCRARLNTAQGSVDALLAGLSGDAVVGATKASDGGVPRETMISVPARTNGDSDPFSDT